MNKKVVVYTSNTCPHCFTTKDYLTSKGIEYTEKNVSESAEYRKELMSKGFMGVPVVMVDDEAIVGFDKQRLDELL